MFPIAKPDGPDGPGLVDELVPGMAAVIDNVIIGLEDPVRQPVFPHELPDILDRVEFRAFWRQWQQGDVVGNRQLGGEMPSGLIQQEHGVAPRCDGERDLLQMQGHGGGVAKRQDKTGCLSQGGTDRAEQIGRLGSLILGSRRSGSTSGPTPGNLVLLTDARLVLPSDFYGLA